MSSVGWAGVKYTRAPDSVILVYLLAYQMDQSNKFLAIFECFHAAARRKWQQRLPFAIAEASVLV